MDDASRKKVADLAYQAWAGIAPDFGEGEPEDALENVVWTMLDEAKVEFPGIVRTDIDLFREPFRSIILKVIKDTGY